MKKIVIIPAYNEEKNIGAVVSMVKQFLSDMDLIVINDGSSDKTSLVVRELGTIVIDLPFNLGIGGAMQTGYKYAALKGYDFALQIDADGQHLPGEATKLMSTMLVNKLDLVIGSRFLDASRYEISLMRFIGKSIFEYLLFLFTGQRFTDPTSGFRLVNQKLIKFFAGNYPQDYPEVESILLAKRKNFAVAEVSVTINPRQAGRSSITPFRSVYYMFKVCLALLVTMLRRL